MNLIGYNENFAGALLNRKYCTKICNKKLKFSKRPSPLSIYLDAYFEYLKGFKQIFYELFRSKIFS